MKENPNNLKIHMKVYKKKVTIDLGSRKDLPDLSDAELTVIDEYLEIIRKHNLDSNKQT